MKSLVNIKDRQKEKDETYTTTSSVLVKRGSKIKTVNSIKTRQFKKDKVSSLTASDILSGKAISKVSKSLKKIAEKRRKELNKINDEIELAKTTAEEGAIDILNKANEEAKSILQEVSQKRTQIKDLKQNLIRERRIWVSKSKELNVVGLQLKKDQKALSDQTRRQEIAIAKTGEEKQLIKDRLDQIDSLLVDLSGVMLVAAQKAELVVAFEVEVRGEISISLKEVETMYNKLDIKESDVNLKGKYQDKREKDLDLRDKQIKDARIALTMAQKELSK